MRKKRIIVASLVLAVAVLSVWGAKSLRDTNMNYDPSW